MSAIAHSIGPSGPPQSVTRLASHHVRALTLIKRYSRDGKGVSVLLQHAMLFALAIADLAGRR